MQSPTQKWLTQLQRYFNNYLWNDGPHGILAKRTYLPIEEGGLNHISVVTFEQAIKLKWIDIALCSPQCFWVAHLEYCLSVPLREFLTYNVHPCNISLLCNHQLSPVMHSVLSIYCKLHFTRTQGHAGLLPVVYNSALKSPKSKSVFSNVTINRLEQKGIHTVQDFVEQYDNLPVSFRELTGAQHMMDRLLGEWLTQVDSGNFGEISPLETLFLDCVTVKKIYSTVLHCTPVPVSPAVEYWEKHLSCMDLLEDWPRICASYKQFVLVKLQTFYLRYINHTYVYNMRRSNWAGRDALCTLCGKADETFFHVCGRL